MEIVTHVLTSPQNLDDARKQTARQNIGAVAGAKVGETPVSTDSDGFIVLPDASLQGKGIVKLVDSIDTEERFVAVTPKAVQDAMAQVGGYKVVEAGSDGKPDVPLEDRSPNYIYLTEDPNAQGEDHYNEWIWDLGDPSADPPVAASWKLIGTTSPDLRDYVHKVSGGTTGNVATLTNDGSIEDSTIAGTDVADAVIKKHRHSNQDILDNINAAYTTEEQTKLTGIDEGAQVNVIEHITANGTELQPSSKTVNIPLAGNGDPGLMTDAEKTKLIGIEPSAQVNVIEHITADGTELQPSSKTVNIPLAGNGDPGLMTYAEKTKLTGIETSAQVNVIEHIIAGDTELSPVNKTVTIPLATDETDGLLPSGMIGGITTAAEKSRIPSEPVSGADRIYSFDDTNGTSWQTIVKEYVGDMILDQQGTPVEDDDGDIMYEEEAIPLWLSYKGVEFGARRAYDDHTGANIHDSIEARTTMAQVTTAIETALANYGGFVVVNSLVDGHPDVQNPSERFIYLYKDSSGPVEDPYTEWIYTANHTWDVIGTTYVDLSPYYTSAEVDSRLATKVDTVTGKGLSTNDYTTEDKNKLTGIEAGAQPNIIEEVQVNGTALSVDLKSVNIPVASGNADGVVNGTDVTRWNSWVYASYDVPLTGVTINGRKYPVVKIGNLLWMAENLDYRWAGLVTSYDYGSTTEPRANYYNNESGTYGESGNKYGLLYNRPAAKYLEDNKTALGIPAGWRVPTSTDVSALLSVAGTGGVKIKSITGWNDEEWAGTNETGFNLYPTGRRINNSFDYVGRMSVLWTSTDSASDYYPALYIDGTQCIGGSQTPSIQYGIRLVKALS